MDWIFITNRGLESRHGRGKKTDITEVFTGVGLNIENELRKMGSRSKRKSLRKHC